MILLRNTRRVRLRAFERGNIEWARKLLPKGTDMRIVVMAFHKARLECREVSDKARIESRDWLIERGLTRFDGSPVAPDGLPK